MKLRNDVKQWRTVALVVLAANAALVGVWALFAPANFYKSFPGLGRSWISGDGPFNEHLVRDVGGLNLSLLVLTIAALWLGQKTMTRVAGLVWLPFALPHVIYHIAHVDHLSSTFDKFAVTGSLALTAVVALAIAVSPNVDRMFSGSCQRPRRRLTG